MAEERRLSPLWLRDSSQLPLVQPRRRRLASEAAEVNCCCRDRRLQRCGSGNCTGAAAAATGCFQQHRSGCCRGRWRQWRLLSWIAASARERQLHDRRLQQGDGCCSDRRLQRRGSGNCTGAAAAATGCFQQHRRGCCRGRRRQCGSAASRPPVGASMAAGASMVARRPLAGRQRAWLCPIAGPPMATSTAARLTAEQPHARPPECGYSPTSPGQTQIHNNRNHASIHTIH